MNFHTSLSDRTLLISKIVGVLVTATLMINIIWLSDDALITLRHALNISHGWGPGFNATESVQGFTHPLWFLLIALIVSGWPAPVLPILLLGLLLAVTSVVLIIWRVTSVGWVVVGLATLIFSNAFMEYSSSGLENALAYLGFSIALLLTTRCHQSLASAIFLGLTVAGLMLTRLDFVLVLAPVVAFSLWRMRTTIKMFAGVVAGALIPIILWSYWALSVYGEVLPNTYWAKRNVDIPEAELAARGLSYLWVSFSTDPVTFLAIAVALSSAFIMGTGVQRTWSVGLIAYLSYVVWIGGDHMVGRYLAVPVLISVGLLLSVVSWNSEGPSSPSEGPGVGLSMPTALAAITLVLVGLLAAGTPPVSLSPPNERRWDMNEKFQVQDERGLWAERGYTLQAFLASGIGGMTTPSRYGLVDVATAARDWPDRIMSSTQSPMEVDVICGGLGTYSILSGPGVHWIDTCALTDAFLARQTYTPPGAFQWFSGHFERDLPAGYVKAVETGDASKLADPSDQTQLEDLWSRIR